MIKGTFQGGRPFVRCRIGFPRLGLSADISFLVDTGAGLTCLHPHDADGMGIPYDLLESPEPVLGVGGTSQYFREPRLPDTFQRGGRAILRLSGGCANCGAYRHQHGGALPAGLGSVGPLADGLRPRLRTAPVYGSLRRFYRGAMTAWQRTTAIDNYGKSKIRRRTSNTKPGITGSPVIVSGSSRYSGSTPGL